jgi:hypothetical protein
VAELVKMFYAFYGNREFIAVFAKKKSYSGSCSEPHENAQMGMDPHSGLEKLCQDHRK